MIVELKPAAENNINIHACVKLQVTHPYALQRNLKALGLQLRSDTSTQIVVRILGERGGQDNFEYQFLLLNTNLDPEQVLERVRTVVLEQYYGDQRKLQNGQARNPDRSTPGPQKPFPAFPPRPKPQPLEPVVELVPAPEDCVYVRVVIKLRGSVLPQSAQRRLFAVLRGFDKHAERKVYLVGVDDDFWEFQVAAEKTALPADELHTAILDACRDLAKQDLKGRQRDARDTLPKAVAPLF